MVRDKARHEIEVKGLPQAGEMTLMSMKMILFRGALSVIVGLALWLFADPLARLLMRTEQPVNR